SSLGLGGGRHIIGEVNLGISQTPTPESVPVSEYIRGTFVPLSNLAHGWQLHTAVSLTPAEERTMVREPAQAVPASISQRLGAKRGLVGPHLRRHRNSEPFERYRDISLVSTAAEYMHGLWHDVQIRVGPDHLPVLQLRRRMELFAELFPPNPGYQVFAEELAK